MPPTSAKSPAPASARKATGPRVVIGQHSIAGRKESNDDSYGVVVPSDGQLATKGIAMAIADGLSSSAAAKQASETCIKSFLEDYYATPESWAVKRCVGTVLKSTNSWLFAQGQQLAASGGMATTFSGLILKAGMAHVFHAGDSRISLVRDGRIEPLTHEHRRRAGPGSGAGGAGPLTRALGADPSLEVDYRTEPLHAGDILVFTTDGVHDHLPATELARLATGGSVATPDAAAIDPADIDGRARAIVEAAHARGSPDNLTCQLVAIAHAGNLDEESHLKSLTVLPFPPELSPGMSFEGYTILRELSATKRGQVYLARDQATGVSCVLKTPSVNFEDDPAYIEMFGREEWISRIAASPHLLAPFHPSGSPASGSPVARPRRSLYLVTEYFDGQTLRQWMADHPRADLEAVRGIVEQIARGLRAMHRKDIVHGDLKPENVMIDRDGLVKIIDFGSARAAGLEERAAGLDEGAAASGEARSALAGTVDYTAPEYLLGDPPSSRGDIYALGCMAYEMLTGRLPYGRGFSSPRDATRLAAVPARTLRDDIPVWVDAALQHATAKRPSERTEALSALVENLRRPNPSLDYDRLRPLIERDPAAFWRALALLELVAIVVLLLALLAR